MPTGEAQLEEILSEFGVPPSVVRPLSTTPAPALLDYLDLIDPPTGSSIDTSITPDSVVEVQGRPLLFVVNESRLSSIALEKEKQLNNLSIGLACRGDDVFLARLRPGELVVERASLDRAQATGRTYRAGQRDALTFFSRLSEAMEEDFERAAPGPVFAEMLRLLTHVADRLASRLARTDVLSLLGRALFFRFLVDRSIVTAKDLSRICPTAKEINDCFSNHINASSTSDWLDRTFNGNFLPLSMDGGDRFFEYLKQRHSAAFTHLSAIIHRWEPAGENYQAKMDWATFDFGHVPVGLLSQIYEAFCWKWEHKNARLTSVHYTPRQLARILVDEAFDSLPNAHASRVLDCACGAGVFLGLAFRRLYEEKWKLDNSRPDTKAIRSILEKQIAGFDISESALRLAALTLYLTAIELDPVPVPPEKLRFKDLSGTVLFNHRRPGLDPEEGPVLGSLGSHVSRKFNGQFDLVLSNPPWTSLSSEFSDPLTAVCRAVFERAQRSALSKTYENPDITPDLPFLLRSTEWCKTGGRIAMALPARILLKQRETPRAAREAIFRLITVSGIINGSNLSDADVWPGMSQPFMLLFAINRRPNDDHVINFITPQYDRATNERGQLIIDSKSAQPLSLVDSERFAWFWKAHAIGTSLDVDVTRRVLEAGGQPLRRYWKKRLHLRCGKGFIDAPEQEQCPASFMSKYRELPDTTSFRFDVDPTSLHYSSRQYAHRPRKEGIYKGPLVLIKESPGSDRGDGRALLSLSDLLYNFSFTGYSASANPNGELLVRYLHLFIHSSVWMHFALMTSPKFAAERRRLYTDDIEACPIIPLEKIPNARIAEIDPLSRRLTRGDPAVFEEIDRFFCRVYGLDELDNEVIHDTLEVALPYLSARKRAWARPTTGEREIFRRRLSRVLRPFFAAVGKVPHITRCNLPNSRMPYDSFLITDSENRAAQPSNSIQALILEIAQETGSSRIIQVIDGGLCLSVLSQYRYWTPTRARLLGAEIVRRHINVFGERH